MAIQTFSDHETERFFLNGEIGKRVGWRFLAKIAARKLDLLHYAAQLRDLRIPPGNHLEALQGNLRGYYSIRINEQWRIVFQWTSAGPINVRIEDYHN